MSDRPTIEGLEQGELRGLSVVPEGDGSGRSTAVRAALGFLGIGARAGAIVAGTQAVRDGVRSGGLFHVILARDAAAGQRAKLVPLLDARRIPYHIEFSQEELGTALGRPPVSAVGLSNPDMARRTRELVAAVAIQGHQQGGG